MGQLVQRVGPERLPYALSSMLAVVMPSIYVDVQVVLAGWSTTFIAFLGDANLALFIGLLGAYALSRWSAGSERTNEAMEDGFHTTGEILLITGVGGSLGAVIERPDSTRCSATCSAPTRARR